MRRVNSFFIILFITLILSNTVFAQEVEKPNLVSIKDTSIANEYFRIADSLMTASYHDSSLVYFEKASKIYEANEMWKKHFRSEFRIIAIYGRIRKFEEAVIKINYVISKSKLVFGEENDAIAYSYFLTGNIYIKKQEFEKSLDFFQKALLLQIKLLGTDNSDVADTYSNMGNVYFYQSKYDKAIKLWIKALDIRKKLFGEGTKSVSDSYNNIAYAYQIKSDYESSLKYYFKSIEIRKKIFGENHIILSDSYINIGIVYLEKSEYDTALKYYNKALEIREAISGEMHPKVADCYNNIGTVFYYKHEYDYTLEYLKKALDIRIETLGKEHTKVAESYGNIGNVYVNINRFDLALEYHLKALPIFIKLLGNKSTLVAETYNNIGVDYRKSKMYDLALENYYKSLKIYTELFGEKHRRVGETYNNIGTTYYSKFDYNLALEYHLKALSIQKEILGEFNIDIINSYNAIADVYVAKNNFRIAQEYYNKAISSNLVGSDINNKTNLNFISQIELLSSIYGKAFSLQKIAKEDNLSNKEKMVFLGKSVLSYRFGDSIVVSARKRITKRDDKLFLGEKSFEIYEGASDICLSLAKIDSINKANLLDKAFYFSEQNKSMVLATSLAKANALQFAGLPDSLIQKEKSLKNGIALYTQKIAEQTDSTKEILYRSKLFDLNREYEKLTSLFENDFPEYYELMHSEKTVSVKQLQSILEEKTAFVEYFTGDSTTYIFTITKTNFTVKSVSIDSTFTKSVENIIAALKTGEFYDFSKESSNLYKTLIEPISNEIAGSTKLVIVPDGIMNKIPFEMLLKSDDKTHGLEEYKYLVNNFEISYSPSASLYYNAKSEKENVKKTNYANLNFLGCAPVFAKGDRNGVIAENTLRSLDTLTRSSITDLRGTIIKLPFSKDEINNVCNLFNGRGKTLIEDEATEENFKEKINNNSYNFVHISTHGIANEENPELSCLAFSQPDDSTSNEDGFLFSGETYNLNLQGTDLLVLSACESGIGKIAKGEGMLSLTRGFLYAGANNILYSLWKINDKFTSEFMTLFYKKMIEEKQTYSSALRETKLEMIKKGVFPGLWASLVLVEN